MVEAVIDQAIRAVRIEYFFGQTGVERHRVLPACIKPLVTPVNARGFQTVFCHAIVGIHVGRHLAATGGRQAAIDHALLVRNDHDVPALARFIGNGVGHRLGHGDGHGRNLAGEVHPQRVLTGSTAAFGIGVPLVHVIAAAHDAEVAGHIAFLGLDWRQRNAIIDSG